MTSFQSSELTELPVVENSQLFAQRAHSARYAPTGSRRRKKSSPLPKDPLGAGGHTQGKERSTHARPGMHSCLGGEAGALPPKLPPPPQTKVTTVGKENLQEGKSGRAIFG